MNMSTPIDWKSMWMEAKEMFEQFICDNCTFDIAQNNPQHRCRSDADSCVEGMECPDYIEYCDCKCLDGGEH